MTYQDLLKYLHTLSPEELEQDVTIYDSYNDEFFQVRKCSRNQNETDVLDVGHVFLTF